MTSEYNNKYCLAYLEKIDKAELDVRLTHDARFSDQKCTPDIVCFIADCIINTKCKDRIFSVYDLWETDYFCENMQAIFRKPAPTDERARHEYDKVLAQPLKLLGYSKVLNVYRTGRRLSFDVRDLDMLEWIARSDRNAFIFLNFYFERVLSASGFSKYMNQYYTAVKNNPDSAIIRSARAELYEKFHTFISDCTPTHSKTDTDRIFHKIFNIFAYSNRIPGSTEELLQFYDLMYNRENWRDINKSKEQTRQEKEGVKANEPSEQLEIFTSYYVGKAIKLIKKLHFVSEVHDQWGNGEATQVHHIFPRADFPQFAAYLENLILLTATQHFTHAHPNNNTHLIDRDYQEVCLLCKADSIEKNIKINGEKYYRKDLFVEVVNTGLSLNLSEEMSFSDIKQGIIKKYNGFELTAVY